MKHPDAAPLRGVTYLASFPDLTHARKLALGPLVALVGRSNSGKSTLLSALCDHVGLAHASRKAGKTRMLNYFMVPEQLEVPRFFLVDLPGYGYAAASQAQRRKLRRMVDSFLLEADELAAVVLVLDARREPESEEEGVMEHCSHVGRQLIFARTKWDRLNAREKKTARESWRRNGIGPLCEPVSAPKRLGVGEILVALRATLRHGTRGSEP